ncbi:hypothetical protein [Pseudanabaena sp. PCC 6802]|uniref:hypothetical protein n=1 Tax=Pseudanabaena sp. PCC 6802 TaxID=118173 RepID=UPI00035ED625|nr:hypothetical protein [Pseudanabaena sp. PCC 6802]
MSSEEWRQVAEQTKGILFLATPHVGSSLADKVQAANDALLKILKVTASVEELSFGHSRLRELNDDFLQDEKLSKIPVWCFGETKPLPVVGIVVDEVSASLSKDLPLIRVTGTDHLTICRPQPSDREDSPVYNSTKRFLKKYLSPQ